MKAGWQIKRLGDLSDLITKGTTPTSVGHAFIPEGINFVKVESITEHGQFIDSKLAHITQECHDTLRRSQLKSGDILFSIAGALGRTAQVTDEILPANTNQALAIIRLKPSAEVLPAFVLLALSSGFALEQIEKFKGGVAQQNLSLAQIQEFQIPIPPPPEQQRIVAILDEAFEGIATAKANAEQNQQNARALFESHLQSVFSERGDGWVERHLGDNTLLEIIDGDRGVNYPKADDFLEEGHCLFMNTKNVRPDGFDFESTMFITEEKDNLLRKGKLKRDDVVMTTRGTIGNIGHYSEDVPFHNIRINSGMLIFRPNRSSLLPSFLFEMLRSEIVKEQIRNQTTGAAQPQLPIKTLVNFKIPVPKKLEDQHAIVKKLREFEPETQHLESIYQQKLAALDALKKSLLDQAFRGEL